ncbi:MAG: HD domain-containing protein [Rhodospirillales bacterium]|nr:HD domain-containing protein [Rhodospirillales bacterium]MCB9995968.1 HD domain-containing protein [Rhodospirillales bacterium]
MSKNGWPDHYNLRDTPDIAERVKVFIDAQMMALKAFDQKRRQWVHDNLPPTYEMTYFFHDHAYRVADDMKKTALHMGMSEQTADNLYLAMLAHDIGKSLLPLHIWDTVEKPENEIKKLRRSHTELGINIIDEVLGDIDHPFIALMKDIMLNHHEQMDGGGYLGKAGDQLSAPVRLACIVESFDGYSIRRHHFGDRDISIPGVLKRMREEKGAAIYDMELFEHFAAMKMEESKTTNGHE